jgi:hypothetical protein
LTWPLAIVCLIAAAPAVRAQDGYTMAVTLLGGVGGANDAEPGSGFGNPAYQVGFSLVTEPQTAVGVRLGRLDLSNEDRFGALSDAQIDYAQVGGEYHFHEGYYESGIYLGLGGYRLRGDRANGDQASETALGGELGLLGDFSLTRNLAIRVEVSGHYVLFDDAHLFAMAQAGLAVRF